MKSRADTHCQKSGGAETGQIENHHKIYLFSDIGSRFPKSPGAVYDYHTYYTRQFTEI